MVDDPPVPFTTWSMPPDPAVLRKIVSRREDGRWACLGPVD